MAIAYTSHWAASRNNVAEVVEQIEHLLLGHRIGVFLFNTRYLAGYTPVHVFRRTLVYIAEAILHGILVHPYACSKFVASEIL